MLSISALDHAGLSHPSAGSSEILSASSSPAPSAGCRGVVSIATSPSDGSGATDPDITAALLAAGVSAGADSTVFASAIISQALCCLTLHQTGSCLNQQILSAEGRHSRACSLLMTVPMLMQQQAAAWECKFEPMQGEAHLCPCPLPLQHHVHASIPQTLTAAPKFCAPACPTTPQLAAVCHLAPGWKG